MDSSDLELHTLFPPAVRRDGEALAFDHRAVRALLPHRGRMLLIDRVASLSLARRSIVAVKQLAQNDQVLEGRSAAGRYFPQTLLVETAAQACGLLMNVLNLLERPGMSEETLFAALVAGKLPRRVPLSVLADSKVRHQDLVWPGEQVEVVARVSTRRAEKWHFVLEVRTDRAIAEGEMLLAYPSYMSDDPGLPVHP